MGKVSDYQEGRAHCITGERIDLEEIREEEGEGERKRMEEEEGGKHSREPSSRSLREHRRHNLERMMRAGWNDFENFQDVRCTL